jgi:hypothetical protein
VSIRYLAHNRQTQTATLSTGSKEGLKQSLTRRIRDANAVILDAKSGKGTTLPCHPETDPTARRAGLECIFQQTDQGAGDGLAIALQIDRPWVCLQ